MALLAQPSSSTGLHLAVCYLMPNFQPHSQYFNNYPLMLEMRAREYDMLHGRSCSLEE